MSATLDAESFAKYFSNQETDVQHLSVPTEPRHPVEVFYLEDMSDNFPSGVQGLAKSLLQYHDEKLLIELEEAEHDSDDDLQTSPSASRIETLKRAVSLGRGAIDSATKPTLSTATKTRAQEREAHDSIVELVAKLALHLSEVEIDRGRKGSILCFLPGWDEIKQVTSLLEIEANAEFKDRMNILPLHSTIPQEDQQRVFKPAAEGTVKVILATNIAESSVTINDVLAVLDGGLVREMNWNAESGMSTMDTVPTSRASATQRLGRAGRVAPGRCFRLYSRGAFEVMLERPAPEIQRTALEATCLSTCSMGVQNGVEKFLGRAMDPPQPDAVSYAVDRLVKLGALSIDDDTPGSGSGEILTPLGRCISRFPLDPAISKMLVMGVVMRCLDPVITAAAGFSSKNTFYNPPGMRDEAQAIRKSFSNSSDTMAQIRAFSLFCSIENEEGWNEACSWAKTNYVSIAAIISIKAVRSQLLDELKKFGLVDSSDLKRAGYKKYALRSDALVNRNADNEMLYTALLATGLPGNLSSRRRLGSFGTFQTRMEAGTGLHPASVTFHRKPPKGREQLPSWYLYREMVLSSQVFLRDCTVMTPEQIALFGGYSMDSSDDLNSMRCFPGDHLIDDWIVAKSSCDDTMRILTSARRDINAALEYKVMHPRNLLPNESQDVIDGICDMFDVLSDEQRRVDE
jgi:ATP-dependent RNA helicase DHX36